MDNLKKYIFCAFLLISNVLFSQKEQIKEIDQLLILSQNFSNKNNLKSLEYAKKASVIAEKLNNSEKKAYSYVYIAKNLSFLSQSKESLEYIEKSIDEDYTDTDVLLQAMIKDAKAYNYSCLGFESEALNNYLSILSLLKSNRSQKALLLKFKSLANIGSHYFVNQEYDKALEYINKAALLLKDKAFLEMNTNLESADLYSLKSNVFLYKNQNDSAFFYCKKAFDIIQKEPAATKYSQYSAMGDYYFKIGNHKVAIDYYMKALEDMDSHKINDAVYKADIYNRLGISYQLTGDIINSKKYIQKYFLEKTIALHRNNVSAEKVANLIKKEKEKEISEYQKKYISLILVIVLLLTIFLLIGVLRYKALKKRKKKMIDEKEIQIEKKEEENLELKQKLELSLEEIKEMAKTNSPIFLMNFLETFPRFQKALLQVNPNLKNSELLLLAYIYLDFPTKEIADFSYKSVRTIQNRKHHLRKKLGILSSEDLYMWIRSNCM